MKRDASFHWLLRRGAPGTRRQFRFVCDRLAAPDRDGVFA
jgi:hypothetical protein